MTLAAWLAALIWEYFRPLGRPHALDHLLDRYTDWLREHFDAGTEAHGLLAWGMGALLPAALAALLVLALHEASTLLGWAGAVLALVLGMGFRRIADGVAVVVGALTVGDQERARQALAEWCPGGASVEGENEIARLAIEETLRQGLQRLFAVLFWFALLGAFGAVLVFASQRLAHRWPGDGAFASTSRRLHHALLWLPTRVAAFSFAIVGNFEDALVSWRGQAAQWGDDNEGVLLAAGGGALGVRLGGNLHLPGGELVRPDLGGEGPADLGHLEGAVNLVIRAVLLWLVVAFLLWLGAMAA